jgi:transposase
MARPKKYPDELVQRGIRLALESERPIAHIAADLGMPPETLRKKVRQHEADSGARPDLPTSQEREEIRRLRAENFELRRANEILKSASVFFAKELDETERGEPLHRCASRPLRRRAHLPDPGRVGVRLLPARDRRAFGAPGRGRAAARAHPRAARRQLLRLRITTNVESAAPGGRARRSLHGGAADARQRDLRREAARQAVVHDTPRSRRAPAPRSG